MDKTVDDVDEEPPQEAIEVDANEAIIILLMIFLQIIHYSSRDTCTC